MQGFHFLLDDGSDHSFLSEHAVGLSSTSENLSGISECECWVPVSEGKSLGWYIRVLCNYFEECINGSRGVALLCRRHSLTYGVYATCIMNLVTTEITRQLIGVMTVEMSCWKFLHTCRYMCCCSIAVNSFLCYDILGIRWSLAGFGIIICSCSLPIVNDRCVHWVSS